MLFFESGEKINIQREIPQFVNQKMCRQGQDYFYSPKISSDKNLLI